MRGWLPARWAEEEQRQTPDFWLSIILIISTSQSNLKANKPNPSLQSGNPVKCLWVTWTYGVPKTKQPRPLRQLGDAERLRGCFTAACYWTGAANLLAWADCPCDSGSLTVVTSVMFPWQPQVWQMWQSCVLSANPPANPLLTLVRKAYG